MCCDGRARRNSERPTCECSNADRALFGTITWPGEHNRTLLVALLTRFQLDNVIRSQTTCRVLFNLLPLNCNLVVRHLPPSTGRKYQCGRFCLYYKSVIAHVETALEIAQKLKSTQLRASDNAGSNHFSPRSRAPSCGCIVFTLKPL